MRRLSLWLSLSCTAAVVLVAAQNLGKTLPGPLAAPHAAVGDLDGGNACSKCHGGWFADLQQSCRSCHQDIDAQLAEHKGLHGALSPERAATCGLCHSEHHGGDFELINRASWSLAGVPDRGAFDHARIGFAMAGRHVELDCGRCHAHADDRVLAAGDRRFLGLSRDCAACHDDAHDGQMRVRCDQCHGQVSFQQPASTGHDRFLALTGGHAATACATCHPENTPRAVLTLGRTLLRQPRRCIDCHESPHRQPLLLAAAPDGETAATTDTCGSCHLPEHATFAAAQATMTPLLHAATGFPLAAPHAEVACEQCHAATGTFAARHPGRTADGCGSCHQDPHGGQFADSPLAQDGCVDCHDRLQFAPHAFTAAKHAQTALPLDGAHQDAACQDCHERAGDSVPRRFHGTRHRCDDCHRDAHDRAFASATGELQQDRRGTCAVCHGTAHFARDGAPFDHGRWTGFRLAGAHALASCDTCHPRAATADDNGRSFGRSKAHGLALVACSTCHDDPHAGRFDRPGLPASVDGRRDCARCHDAASFRALERPFDHGRWTGFRLQGAHADAACSSCHQETGLRTGAAIASPVGTACADCHEEPHGGQFAAADPRRGGAARTDCARCHQDGRAFAELRFDHERDARFALGDAHKNVACAACHRPVDVAGHSVVRYRPLPRECTDCHGQQQDPLRRRRRQEDGR